jgi:hypothetical protein
MDMGCCRTRLGVIQSIHFIGYCSIHTSIHSIASSAADAYVRGARPALSRDYDSHVGATLTMKPAGIAQMYPKNALGALEAISGGKGAGANVNKKRSLSFGTEEYGFTGSFGNELPSLSSAQRSIPNGTAGATHVADDVTSSQTTGHLAQSRKISRYGYRTHVTS